MSPTALIVDDEPHILRVAALALRTAGCIPVLAADGEQAWHEMQTHCPDILISDVQMPNLDGIQLLRRIRNTPEFAGLPIILLTAKGFELKQFEPELVGSCDIMSKPFSPAALSRRVREILSARVNDAVGAG